MGMIEKLLELLFGSGRNVLRETAEIFHENAENGAERSATLRSAALGQFAAEFAMVRKSPFDRFMDALNRVPRPLMAFGTIGLCVSAMIDPIWFAARMQGIALVPEPLWWLLGSIVSFYFGARFQIKSQEFQRSIAATMAAAPMVHANIGSLASLEKPSAPFKSQRSAPVVIEQGAAQSFDQNAALAAWKAGRHE